MECRTGGRCGRNADVRQGSVKQRGRVRERVGLPIFVVGQECTAVPRRDVNAQVAAGNVTLNVGACLSLVAIAAGIDVTRSFGPGKKRDHTHLSALVATVRRDGYPNGPEEVKQRYCQSDLASHYTMVTRDWGRVPGNCWTRSWFRDSGLKNLIRHFKKSMRLKGIPVTG